MMYHERLHYLDLLSTDEIVIAISQDPAFTLPRGCAHPGPRMAAAYAALKREIRGQPLSHRERRFQISEVRHDC